MCCQVEVSATSLSLTQRSPTECGVTLCVIKNFVNEEAIARVGPQRHVEKRAYDIRQLDITKVIKSNRLTWAGNVVRIDDKELPKQVLWTNRGCQRGRGRMKSRWFCSLVHAFSYDA
jgi:hypothetical protein